MKKMFKKVRNVLEVLLSDTLDATRPDSHSMFQAALFQSGVRNPRTAGMLLQNGLNHRA